MCIKVDQLDAQILMCLYLSLSALHVPDSLVHHQERHFGAVYRNWYKLKTKESETCGALNDK